MLNGGFSAHALLTHGGKILLPFCIAQAFGLAETSPVNILACEEDFAAHHTESEAKPPSYPEGTYALCVKGEHEGWSEYYAYKHLGSWQGLEVIIQFNFADGRTGDFSSIELLKLDRGVLIPVKIIAGGDRAWGAIKDGALSGSMLTYTQFLNDASASVYLGLSEKASQILYNCAACFGFLGTFTYNLETQEKTLVKLELLSDWKRSYPQSSLQENFDVVFIDQIKSKSTLEGAALEVFKKKLQESVH